MRRTARPGQFDNAGRLTNMSAMHAFSFALFLICKGSLQIG